MKPILITLAKILLAGLLASRLSAQTNLCGRVADVGFGVVQVYCVPNLAPFATFFQNSPVVQVWIQVPTQIAQSYFVIFRYRFAGIPLTEYRMIWGSGLFAASFPTPSLEPTSIFVYQLSSGRAATIQ